jgi:hypothetical protein
MQFNITTFNGLNMSHGEYMVLEIPPSFTFVNNTPICANTSFNCNFLNSDNNYVIKIDATSLYSLANNNVNFVIKLNRTYISPTNYNFDGDYFYVTTFTSNNLIIDKTSPEDVSSSAATFYLTCTNKCKTCNPANLSQCTSCYTQGSGEILGILYDGYNVLNSSGDCVNQCGYGQYNNSGLCQNCTPPC